MDRKDPVIVRIGSEKADYLEREGWDLSPDGTRFFKTLPGGNQLSVTYEEVRDWTLQELIDFTHGKSD